MTQYPGWKRVYIAEDPLQAATMATILEGHGLSTRLHGMELWSAAVEILFSEGAAPSVWVPARQEQTALDVLAKIQAPETRRERDWLCWQCGESVPASFETCWQCGALDPLLKSDLASSLQERE